MECIICDKPISKTRRTCSDACKQQAYRNAKRNETAAVTHESVTVKPAVTPVDLWPKYRWSNESDYVMTDYEREHYKPAHELDAAKGEHNPVSLPGDAHYNGVCLAKKYDDRRKPRVGVIA